MKNILKEISNPYDIDNFKKILELYQMSKYMTSEGRQSFYKYVVSYNGNLDNLFNQNYYKEKVENYAKKPILANGISNSHWEEVNYCINPRRSKT